MHLFHPVFVHFSVAFLVTGGLCEVWGILGRHEARERFGAALLLLGTVSLLPTVATGFLAGNSVDPLDAKSHLVVHERVGLAVLGLFLASQFWKAWGGGRLPERQRKGYVVLVLIGVALVVFGAYVGGDLVYVHGVGVDR